MSSLGFSVQLVTAWDIPSSEICEILILISSGKLTLLWKTIIFAGKPQYEFKWPFSIAICSTLPEGILDPEIKIDGYMGFEQNSSCQMQVFKNLGQFAAL